MHAFALFSSIQRHAAAAMAAAVTITTTNEYINRRRKREREREREGKEIVACVVNSKVVKLISQMHTCAYSYKVLYFQSTVLI